MKGLLHDIASCTLCEADLPLGCRPVLRASTSAKIMIIGQAPGTKVHASGIPWDDASGKRLREWMGLSNEAFYDESQIAIVPMGFCYPGKGKSGDLPPRPECAPKWHHLLWDQMPNIELTLLIGQYAQHYYLGDKKCATLTETVKQFQAYGSKFIPLPHPSPRNQIWLKKNEWFERDVVPVLKQRIAEILA